MFPEVAGLVAQIDSVGEPITIQGFKRFEARTRDWGNYPVIQRDEIASVEGLLFRELTEKQLAKLDWYEDVDHGLYVREQVQHKHGGKTLDVQLYVCGPALERRLLEPLSKPWDPVVFRKNELDRYLNEIVLPTIGSDVFKSTFNA